MICNEISSFIITEPIEKSIVSLSRIPIDEVSFDESVDEKQFVFSYLELSWNFHLQLSLVVLYWKKGLEKQQRRLALFSEPRQRHHVDLSFPILVSKSCNESSNTIGSFRFHTLLLGLVFGPQKAKTHELRDIQFRIRTFSEFF